MPVERLGSRPGLPDDLELGTAVDQPGRALAVDGVVIGDHDAHEPGRRDPADGVHQPVPRPSARSTASTNPTSSSGLVR